MPILRLSQRTNDIDKAIIAGLKLNGRRVFETSQKNVPTGATGELKSSGTIIDREDGYEIIYSAPYAYDVEYGIKESRPLTGLNLYDVRAHTRRGKRGDYIVSGHVRKVVGKYVYIKKFTNYPWNFSGEEPESEDVLEATEGQLGHNKVKGFFRVLKWESARPGQYFLRRALLKELSHLSEDIASCLEGAEVSS